MEAALGWHDLILTFVTDDVSQEDTLGIDLLDPTFNVIDMASLGAMDATGSFRGLELKPPDAPAFRFFGDVDWKLQLYPSAIFTLPFVTDPPGVHRPLSFHRHCTLTGNPTPESA